MCIRDSLMNSQNNGITVQANMNMPGVTMEVSGPGYVETHSTYVGVNPGVDMHVSGNVNMAGPDMRMNVASPGVQMSVGVPVAEVRMNSPDMRMNVNAPDVRMQVNSPGMNVSMGVPTAQVTVNSPTMHIGVASPAVQMNVAPPQPVVSVNASTPLINAKQNEDAANLACCLCCTALFAALLCRASVKQFCQLNQPSNYYCLLYTSPSPRDQRGSRMPSSA
eukprot:TRINITY_DN104_c0_g1_i1.p1 TRINITY_DN104_c0_g1~~TRINITY_DN104_c0_g1_i1.p1  ORF type:complete len:221 (+),score=58.51 TRINITY_DN104_c0_g1_i1:64-726(+)